MKKPNLHRLAALAACLLCCTYFTIPAYACLLYTSDAADE